MQRLASFPVTDSARSLLQALVLCGLAVCAGALTAAPIPNSVATTPDTMDTPFTNQTAPPISSFPLMFIPNEGQWEAPVAYFARTQSADVSFYPGEVGIRPRRQSGPIPTVRIKPLDTSSEARITPGQALRTRVGYFIGQDPERWRPDLTPRESLRYSGLYRGIDLIFREDQGELAYDIEIAPGADPGQVRIELDGVKSLTLDRAHVMTMTLPDGTELRQQTPLIYQEIDGKRIPVSGGFVLLESDPEQGRHVFGFSLADYDRAAALTIDPTLTYSTFVGGSADDQALAMGVTDSGQAVVGGGTLSTTLPGDLEAGPRARQDAILYRLSPDGQTLEYVAILGGSRDERINGVALDGDDVYITGQTKSADFPTTAALYPLLPGGTAQAAFVAKLSTTASPPTLEFSTYLGGTGIDAGIAIGIDATDLYVAGDTTSTNLPTYRALYPASPGSTSTFLLKLSLDGQLLRSLSYFGGSGIDKIGALQVTSEGDLYVAGSTTSRNLPTKNAIQSANAGITDGFVLHIGPTGDEIVSSTYLGGTRTDAVTGLAIDQKGDLVLAGYTDSTDFPVHNAIYPTLAGKIDAFVAKLDQSGRFLHFATYLGGENDDLASGAALDSSADPATSLRYIYVAGTTESNSLPADNAYQGYHAGLEDGFLAKLDPRGSRVVYTSFFGGSTTDQVHTLATIPTTGNRSILLAGQTNATATSSFPISATAVQPSPAGRIDQFVARIDDTLYDATRPVLQLSFIDDHYPEGDFDPLDPNQQAGAHVTFDLVLSNPASTGASISAFSTLMKYDPEELRYEGITWNPDAAPATDYPPTAVELAVGGPTLGELSLALYQTAPTPIAISDGIRVAELQFEIRNVGDPSENPPRPSKLLTLTQQDATALDLTSHEVRIVGGAGGLLITRPCNRLIGDCDCSSAVQLAEVQVAAQTATNATNPAPICMKIDGRAATVGIHDMQLIVNNFIYGVGEVSTRLLSDASRISDPLDDAWWTDRQASGALIRFGAPAVSGNHVSTSLALSGGANRISGLIVDLYYDADAMKSITPSVGPAAQSAGKTLSFATVEPGWTRLLILGMNTTTIADGIIADLDLETSIDLRTERTTLAQAPSATSSEAALLPIAGESLELGPDLDLVALTVTKQGHGSGRIRGDGIDCGSQCSGSYPIGSDVALTASADTGSTFAGWSGACGGSGTCALRITTPVSVTATFMTNDSVECAINSRTLPGRDFTGEHLIRAEDALLTSGPVIVHDRARVVFEASRHIVLNPGFTVQAGGRFQAHLAGVSCQN